MKVVTVKFRSRSGSGREKLNFIWGLDFPVMSRRIDRRVSSSVRVAPYERPTVVGENYSQKKNEKPACRRQVLLIQRDYQGRGE